MSLFADRVDSLLEASLPKCLCLKRERMGGQSAGGTASSSLRGALFLTPRSNGIILSPTAVTVASNAHASQREKPIYESLLEKGRLVEKKKEAMRLAALEGESRKLQPAPSITYTEVKNTPRHEQRVEDRLLQWGKEAEERRRLETRRREEELIKEMSIIAPFRPNITRKGRNTTPKVRGLVAEEALTNRSRQREQRRVAAHPSKLLEGLNEMKGTPIVNRRSERLAARRREKEGLSGLSIIDVLMKRDRITQMKRREQDELASRAEHIPQITLYAATLDRDGDAAERLYADSYEREERRLQKEKHLNSNDIAPFTPQISPYAAMTPRFRNVEDELMQKHMQSMALKEEAQQREHEQELRRHHPMINPVSELLASKLPETSCERLYHQPQRTPRHMDPVAMDLSFCGSFNKCGRVSSLPGSLSETLQSYEESRYEMLRKLREEQERIVQEECTFMPVTNTRRSKVGGAEDVAARNQEGLARKEEKSRKLRKRNELEVKRCALKHERGTSIITSSRGGERVYGDDGIPCGVQEYLESREEEHRLKREREVRPQKRLQSPPRTSLTTPQEFLLGQCGGVSVASLRHPSPWVVCLVSPKKEDTSPLVAVPQPEQQPENDLSMYERIYNRIYRTVPTGEGEADGSGSDGETSFCAAPSLYI